MEEKIIYSVCAGVMKEEDFVIYQKETWGHDEYYGFNEVFDTVQADWSEFDFGYLFAVAKAAGKLKSLDPNSKLAWVVLEGKQKQLTDFYKAAKSLMPTKSRSFKAFYSNDEAMQWLKNKH